jgi:hypothetical protein
MDFMVYTIGLHIYQFKFYSSGDVLNVFFASFQYPLSDGAVVLFPAFGRDLAHMDRSPFITVCISKN